MGFQDVSFQPSELGFTSHFLKIMVEAKALELPHVLKLWFRLSKSMLNKGMLNKGM